VPCQPFAARAQGGHLIPVQDAAAWITPAFWEAEFNDLPRILEEVRGQVFLSHWKNPLKVYSEPNRCAAFPAEHHG
jgi:hypothetical protein